ncbi:MAG: hypothetical protein QOK42_2500 [Frankiaceae bacterium]|jgi:prepilin-type N-terminal cleavage/methylation domain-containing protein|nr:hypothetical protein [Frankiaceae bacterium]MDX6275642.1 hypothetical protein [Frankiales bacterium]
MRRAQDDDGFTLVELLISISILTIVIGAITTAMIVYFQIGRSSMERDDHSGKTDVAASYLNRDLGSTGSVTAVVGNGSTGTSCDNASNKLTLSWKEWTASAVSPSPAPGGTTYVAAYRVVSDTTSSPVGGAARWQLERWYCAGSATPQQTVLVQNMPAITDFSASPASLTGCSATSMTVTLKRYGSSTTTYDTGSDYVFTGCLGGRAR